MNRDRWTRWLYPSLGLCLLAFSFSILNRELARYNLQDIWQSLREISDRQLLAALGFTLLSCLIISSYDLIAFRCFQYRLNLKRILFTTFITYAVSNTTGFTLLIGGGIRYRFYSLWGVPPRIIAKIIALGNLTFWLGLLTLTGITFIFNPLQSANPLNIGSEIIIAFGFLALLLVAVYLYCCHQRKRFVIKNKVIAFPELIVSLGQIIIFSLDWALAAAVLYCLIPDYSNQTYWNFFNIYLIAMTASIMSNIPGGLGVFETAMIFLLPNSISTPDILSSLLIYRSIRFLLPLAIALFFICCFEVKRRF